MNKFPLDKVFELLEPGPVIMITTSYKGKMNVMTMSWQTPFDFTPQIGLIISNRNYTFELLKKSKECTISIPSTKLLKTSIDIGKCTGSKVDKFEKFKLATLPAKKIKAPLLKDVLYNIECKLVDATFANKYCLFIVDGVYAWKGKQGKMFHSCGNGLFGTLGKPLNFTNIWPN